MEDGIDDSPVQIVGEDRSYVVYGNPLSATGLYDCVYKQRGRKIRIWAYFPCVRVVYTFYAPGLSDIGFLVLFLTATILMRKIRPMQHSLAYPL